MLFRKWFMLSLLTATMAAHECEQAKSRLGDARTSVPDIYYLNLDKSRERRSFMERQLRYYNLLGNAHRVRAYVPEDLWIPPEIKVPDECKVYSGKVALGADNSESRVFIDGHCGRPKNSKRELTVTASHLRALFEATHAPNNSLVSSPYALILEDDLQLAFDIDWVSFFKTAPGDFAMLQLVTSNERDVQLLYSKYKKSSGAHLWHKRLDKNDFWCAGAYIVHKERMRPVIDRIVRLLSPGVAPKQGAGLENDAKLAMTVMAGYSRPCFPKLCCNEVAAPGTVAQDHEHGFENIGKFTVGGGGVSGGGGVGSSAPGTHKACIFAARGYQADHYIFSLARRFTYMLTVPIVGGAGVGNVSTLHQDHVSMHVGAFARIDSIQSELQRGTLPGFAGRDCSFKKISAT